MKITKTSLKRIINTYLNEQLEFPSGEEIDQKLISLESQFDEDLTEEQYEQGVKAWAEIYTGTVSVIQNVKEMIPSVLVQLKNMLSGTGGSSLMKTLGLEEKDTQNLMGKFESTLNAINNSGAADAFLSYGVIDSEKVVRSFYSKALVLGSDVPSNENSKIQKSINLLLKSGPSILNGIKNSLDSLLKDKPEKDNSGEYALLDKLAFLYDSFRTLLRLNVQIAEAQIETQYLFGAMELKKMDKEDLIFMKFCYFILKTGEDIFQLPENLLNKFLNALEKDTSSYDDYEAF